MNKFILILILFFSYNGFSQSKRDFLSDFNKGIAFEKLQKKYDIISFSKDTLRRDVRNKLDSFDSTVFLNPINHVIEFEDEGVTFFIKTIEFTYKELIRVSQIYLDPNKLFNGDLQKTSILGDSILNYILLNPQTNFTQMNKKYSSDGTEDLGRFFKGTMVSTFEEVIFKSKKGEVLKIQTEYGYHIVLVTESPRSEKAQAFLDVVKIKFKN